MTDNIYSSPKSNVTDVAQGQVLKHSGIGIAAFILSIIAGLVIVVTIGVAGYLETVTQGGLSEDSVAAMVVGMIIILSMLLELVAVGLSVAGLVQRNVKKVFSVLGLIFSIAALLLVLFIMILGLTVS